MATTLGTSASPPGSLPIGPSEEEWRRMTKAEREHFLTKVLDALSDPRSAMSEGRPHKKAQTRGLSCMVDELQAKAEQAQTKAEQAQAKAEQAQAKAEQAEATAVAGLREAVLAVLDARGIACPDDARARLLACDDLATLQRWLRGAKTASTAAEAFAAETKLASE